MLQGQSIHHHLLIVYRAMMIIIMIETIKVANTNKKNIHQHVGYTLASVSSFQTSYQNMLIHVYEEEKLMQE